MRGFLLIAFVALSAAGCREHRPVGAQCSDDFDCESELCVAEDFMGPECKQRCGQDIHCPTGQVCDGRAEGYVAYCVPADLP